MLFVSDHKRAIFKRKEDGVKNKKTINIPKNTTLKIKPTQKRAERRISTGFDSIIKNSFDVIFYLDTIVIAE